MRVGLYLVATCWVRYPDTAGDDLTTGLRVAIAGRRSSIIEDLCPGVGLHVVLVEIVLPVHPVVAPEDVDIVLKCNTGVEGPRTWDRPVRGQLVPAPRLLEFLYITDG